MKDGRQSIQTIDSPQFINLEQDAINPGISKCEVKVLYLGKNRNGSFIDYNAAMNMAKTLRCTPIVGAYRKDIEDFGDHGQIAHIEDGKIEFSCKTIPYGFVAPDAPMWFQNFVDTDELGNSVEREYLMTTGYLWTGQYPEVESCITEGKGQSMELDPEKMSGQWATDSNTEIDFFIINDAVFTKLCILGDDVEPCFEGAAVTRPEISKDFSLNQEFSTTLYNMMNELKSALQIEGGSSMSQAQEEVVIEETATELVDETATEEEVAVEAEPAEDVVTDFSTEEEEDDDDNEGGDDPKEDDPKEDDPKEEEKPKDDDKSKSSCSDPDKKKTQHSLEQEPLITAEELAAMREELDALKAYKLTQENAQKDALIAKYFMLDNEDKKEIIENKEQYTLDEIESKLAVIYVQKNVDFSTLDGSAEETEEEEEDPITTFSLDTNVTGVISPLAARLRETNNY